MTTPRRLARLATVVTLLFWYGTGCGKDSSSEDDRRTRILSEDPIFDLSIPDVEPTGSVTTEVGGGEGPAAHSSDARRSYMSENSPDALLEPLTDAARNSGWEVLSSQSATDESYVQGTKRHEGFGATLNIYIRPNANGSSVLIQLETSSAAVSPNR